MGALLVLSVVATAVAAPDLADLASAFRGRPGKYRRYVSRWWLATAVAVPHAALIPAAMWFGGAS